MAAISLGFIVIITPWTIQEIVATCTGSKIPPSIDFCVTWIALSSSFWNPFLYWLLNARFRRICKDLLTSKCISSQTSLEEKYSMSLEYDHQLLSGALPLPPGPPPATICRSANHTPRSEYELGSAKYWGNILERTFSTGSMNAIHHSTSSGSYHQQQQQGHPMTLHRHHHRQHRQHQQQHQQHHHQHQNGNSILHKSTLSIGKELHAGMTRSESSEFTVVFPTTNSDPQMSSCEHELHDINCAKNQAFFVGFNHHQTLPDI
ncbi:uncharacterized protein LOC129746080 [Uranotaenia lowii]|uniref:uncharacterized protein LOC129746080 n=1 Tax=Uranotaenia lowii TaxID=190385 RepID=UPI002479FB73|nr:uncharacterized protein LOC129746080 [Uranotaenia lowii]